VNIEKLLELVDDLAAVVLTAETPDPESLDQVGEAYSNIKKELTGEPITEIESNLAVIGAILERLQLQEAGGEASELQAMLPPITEIQNILRRRKSGDFSVSATKSSSLPEEETDDLDDGYFTLPEYVDQEVYKEFLSNFGHVLDEIEQDILLLEKGNASANADLKRRIHSLKGEAGVLSLEDVETVCHAVEDVLGENRAMRTTTDLLLETVDWMRRAGKSYVDFQYPTPRGEAQAEYLRARTSDVQETQGPDGDAADSAAAVYSVAGAAVVETASAFEPEPGGEAPAEAVVHVDWDEETVTLVGEFLEESEEGLAGADQILMNIDHAGMEPEKVNALFRTFHTIKGVSGFLELAEITKLAHTTETMLDQVREGVYPLEGPVLDLVFDSTELMRNMLKAVRAAVENGGAIQKEAGLANQIKRLDAVIKGKKPEPELLPEAAAGEKLGQILAKSNVPPAVIDAAIAAQKQTGRLLGEELVAQGAVKAKEVSHALRAQRASAETAAVKIKETVKVDLERVDRLVEMIGELVIVESMVVHADEIASLASPKVRTYLSQLEKITRDLQDTGMRMRMVPVRGVFQKMARMVRDLARKSGKSVRMVTSGEGTEMDRSMVEQVTDPLVHMIRNAVDHAIEPSEVRMKAGKPAEGEVTLSAYHEGGSIVIEIADDGKGLDRDAIIDKAVRQGLITGGDQLTDSEVFKLIFAPGFSTAAKVTEISGRGVGMDVVKRNIESMRGRISIESEKGKGTTFKLILPLTLAIIDGMLVSCGPEKYIVPTLSIVESLQVNPSMLNSFADKGELINVRGEIFPLIRMNQLFEIDNTGAAAAEGLVVVIEGVGKKVALFVDDVLTQQQVVIKSLGNGIEKTPFISGGAIMSDGTVGLILNVEEIAALVDKRSNTNLDHAIQSSGGYAAAGTESWGGSGDLGEPAGVQDSQKEASI